MQITPARLDQLILEEAEAVGLPDAAHVIVLDDPEGALTDAALALVSSRTEPGLGVAGGARVHLASRDLRQARRGVAIAEDAGLRDLISIAGMDGPLDTTEFLSDTCTSGRVIALTHLPKSLAELDHLGRSLAQLSGDPTLVAGGNTKHMTRSQNDTLAASFGEVRATRGQGKFRCLVAENPLEEVTPPLPTVVDSEHGNVHGVGGVFGGANLDRGGMVMTDAALDDIRAWIGDQPCTILDLGCGNGSVSLALLNTFPAARVIATDVATDAVLSAEKTLAPFDDRVELLWDDAAMSIDDAEVDAVLLNPPFHAGTRIDATLIQPLVDAAHRVLYPGGALYLVHNSSLRYRPLLEDRFGRVTELSRNATFTVLRADRDA